MEVDRVSFVPSQPPPDLYVVSRGAEAEAQALPLARLCRRAGLVVEIDPSGAAFAKQFKRADRSGAAWAAVIGEDEASAGVVLLRELRPRSTEGAPAASPDQRLTPEQLTALLAR